MLKTHLINILKKKIADDARKLNYDILNELKFNQNIN